MSVCKIMPFELAAFPCKGSVTPVYSRQVFLSYRQLCNVPMPLHVAYERPFSGPKEEIGRMPTAVTEL